jgi:hypothetical protein
MEGPFYGFLSMQGLTRSIDKTKHYSNAVAAISSLKDGRLASLGYWLGSGADLATAALRTAFEQEIAEEGAVSPSRFRFILKTLRNRGDDFAAASLASNSELANIDPKMSGEYLALVGLTAQPVLDAMFTQLHDEPTDERDALDLHFLRAPRNLAGGEGTKDVCSNPSPGTIRDGHRSDVGQSTHSAELVAGAKVP